MSTNREILLSVDMALMRWLAAGQISCLSGESHHLRVLLCTAARATRYGGCGEQLRILVTRLRIC
jgi:hypothetical protein